MNFFFVSVENGGLKRSRDTHKTLISLAFAPYSASSHNVRMTKNSKGELVVKNPLAAPVIPKLLGLQSPKNIHDVDTADLSDDGRYYCND